MHRLATVPFLTLILLVVCGGSKASVQISSASPGCDGYWTYTGVKKTCWTQNMGTTKRSGVSPNPPSVSRHRSQQPSSGAGVGDQQQETQGSVSSSSTTSRGTNQLGSDGEDTFPKEDVKQVYGSAGTLSMNPIAQPSGSPREPTDATPVVDRKEEGQVDQRGLESGSAKQQNTTNGNGEEENGGKGRGSGDHATGHDRGGMAQGVVSMSGQGSAQRVETVAEQPVKNKEDDIPGENVKGPGSSHVVSTPERRNTLETVTDNGDQQKSGESNAQGENSGSCKGRAVILPVILILMYS
ncbi:expression site-associated gene (ESAG) protein, putative [Trypanosoma brucei brucei TREU927]|uniref:Expression site-associated gene (ESAG) protein, putative n=1 Tax=Trypanosoma brucei brucei (strain 927/4 GUTat10.1) TaxID=185431 RepID=Q57X44_TRYB2|nr:expression site-associated gene (ESAG) protein, putative [Trypanosoma brucei brucei TREU927]AAX69832.1 expression site-associated gene (ESAG) protein, putative [Trypanosoma brucei]AAZ11571.1 expression site-associated gene (ESAG) protein, putative [Trypanosoma brucei brucei TREU927]